MLEADGVSKSRETIACQGQGQGFTRNEEQNSSPHTPAAPAWPSGLTRCFGCALGRLRIRIWSRDLGTNPGSRERRAVGSRLRQASSESCRDRHFWTKSNGTWTPGQTTGPQSHRTSSTLGRIIWMLAPQAGWLAGWLISFHLIWFC